ncbi:hypothetical protein ACLUS7_01110 [Enterobacterales bacterium BD_CKDN230030183-1A_HGKHYDSX7]
MKQFTDDKLTRAFRKSLGLPEDSTQDTPEDALLFQREMDALESKPYGSVGRKFYRELRSRRARIDDNYDWLDEPGAADTLPIEHQDSQINSTKSKHLAMKFGPAGGYKGVDVASVWRAMSEADQNEFKPSYWVEFKEGNKHHSLKYLTDPEKLSGVFLRTEFNKADACPAPEDIQQGVLQLFMTNSGCLEGDSGCGEISANPFVDLEVTVHALEHVVRALKDEAEEKSKHPFAPIKEFYHWVRGEHRRQVEWQVHQYPDASLYAKGSDGDDLDYLFTVTSHGLSLSRLLHSQRGEPVVIFDVDNAAPEVAGSQIISAFKDMHLEGTALNIMEPLKEVVVQQQTRVH